MMKLICAGFVLSMMGAGCDSDSPASGGDTSTAADTQVSGDTEPGDTGLDVAEDTLTPADTVTALDVDENPDVAPSDVMADLSAPDDVADTTEPLDGISDTVSDTTEPGDTTQPAAECTRICAARTEDSGLCTQEGYFDIATCEAYCDRDLALWDAPAKAAFETCASTDPLCFQSIHQCMMMIIYADAIEAETPIPMTVTVTGADFGAYDGDRIFAEFQHGFFGALAIDSAFVTDGGFTLTADFNEVPGWDAVFYLRAYLNRDGVIGCGVETDLGFGGDVTPRFGTSPLRFERALSVDGAVDTTRMQAVCDAF